MGVRRFTVEDIPEVASLWWRFLRKKRGSAPPRVLEYLRALYFSSPLVEDDLPSLVYEAKDGKVVGFLGVVVRRFCLRGRAVRVAFGGNYVVDPTSRTTLAGLQLLARYMAANQDLSMTDSATEVSRNLLERLGFHTILPFSIAWARPLRPTHYAAHAMAAPAPNGVAAAIRIVSKPFCSFADAVACKIPTGPFHLTEPQLRAENLDADTLLKCIAELGRQAALRATTDDQILNWLLRFMEQMHPRATLRKRLIRNEKDKIVGWYLYYLKPHAPCQVIQIGAVPQFQRTVIQHLLYDARSQGAIGLHGAAPPHLMAHLADENCFFTCRSGWTVAHSRDPEIVEALSRGDVSFSRLDGEWCLNFDD